MNGYYVVFVAVFFVLLLAGCASHSNTNLAFETALKQRYCGEEFFADNAKKIDDNDDVIYYGINAGSIARACGDYEKSNEFFDRAEESYKYDVDLESLALKGSKLAVGAVLNETFLDYDGSLYERIMVNVYKGLNYMQLGDFSQARVEFNRALLRQNKAKEYFAKQIEKNKEMIKKAEETPNYEENTVDNAKSITQEYDRMFADFSASKNFVNPYATYIASLFFFLDKDYRRAFDLFKEVAVTNKKIKEFDKEFKVLDTYAKSTSHNKLKKYIFLVYEDGLGVVKDEFSLTLPFIVEKKVISVPMAFQKLKKREASYGYIALNDAKTAPLVDFDNIVATEFKLNMPTMISKALAATILKTTLNAVVASNDKTGGYLSLAVALTNLLTTKADIRAWQSLPKQASVVMVENKGVVEIKTPFGDTLATQEVSKNKNVLVVIRSYETILQPIVNIIEER